MWSSLFPGGIQVQSGQPPTNNILIWLPALNDGGNGWARVRCNVPFQFYYYLKICLLAENCP